MSRDLSIRKSASINPDSISLPLIYINPHFGYSINSIRRHIDNSPLVLMKSNSFPSDISEYYWIQEGELGKDAWYAIGCLEDNIYFLYKAYAHTSFDKDGYMELWVSYIFSDIIHYAMDTSLYNKYFTGTSIN